MNEENGSPEPSPNGGPQFPTLAFALGLIPSVLLFAAFTVAANGFSKYWVGRHWHAFFGTVCTASAVSCFISSRMLFRSKFGVVATVILLLFNLAISLFLGCVAAWQGV
jgi:hypothetical protein